MVSTLGEWAVAWQRESPREVAILLSLIFLAKAAGALLPLANERGLLPFPRVWRTLFWCAAALLMTYGAVNTIAALAALGSFVGSADTMDTAALVGHAFLWDPLFLIWGLFLALALRATRTSKDRPSRLALNEPTRSKPSDSTVCSARVLNDATVTRKAAGAN